MHKHRSSVSRRLTASEAGRMYLRLTDGEGVELEEEGLPTFYKVTALLLSLAVLAGGLAMPRLALAKGMHAVEVSAAHWI